MSDTGLSLCRVVLVRTQSAGNVGAVARLMRNLGLDDLALVAPECDPFSHEARQFARYGEELMAWVIVRGDAHLDADALRAYCQGRIAHFKIPRYVKVVDAFPMTVTGKVQKFRMREQAMADLGLKKTATA